MNKFIEEQLHKINVPLPEWDSNTTKIIIPKQSTTIVQPVEFQLGGLYNICIEDYVLNPPPNFTLAVNWNGGTTPPEKEMVAEVIQIAGKMIKFNCKGKTTGETWEGWLPRKTVTMR